MLIFYQFMRQCFISIEKSKSRRTEISRFKLKLYRFLSTKEILTGSFITNTAEVHGVVIFIQSELELVDARTSSTVELLFSYKRR